MKWWALVRINEPNRFVDLHTKCENDGDVQLRQEEQGIQFLLSGGREDSSFAQARMPILARIVFARRVPCALLLFQLALGTALRLATLACRRNTHGRSHRTIVRAKHH